MRMITKTWKMALEMEYYSQQLLFPSWLLILSLVIPLLFILRMKNNHGKNSRLPPGPWKLPLIGNLHNLIGGDEIPFRLHDLAKKYGPVMHLNFGEVSTVILSSPDAAKEFLKTHDVVFSYRPEMYATRRITYNCIDIAFSPYGEYWRQIRKICALELLSPRRVKSFRKVRQVEVANMIETVGRAAAVGEPVNLSRLFMMLSNNVVCRTAFGEKCRHQKRFLEAIEVEMRLSSGFNLSDLFPSLEFTTWITGLKWSLDRSIKALENIYDEIIDEHIKKREGWKKDHKKAGQDEEDFIDTLLRIQEEGDGSNINLGPNNVKAVVHDMFSGGTDTAATTLEWIMSELIRNTETLDKVTSEVRRTCEYGKHRIDETTIAQMSYMNNVIKENFRLHPPIPLVPRECSKDTEVCGFQIPKKTRIVVNVWAIGRSPEQWEEPDQFKPERFDERDTDYKGTNFELIPFGAGRRICPGMTFGLATVELALANILYHFDWKMPDGASGSELDMGENFGISMGRKRPLVLVPVAVPSTFPCTAN